MEWCDDELFRREAPLKRVVLTIKLGNKEPSPYVKLKSTDFRNETGKFIIDTGSELNIIKQKLIKADTLIDSSIKFNLFGINELGVRTHGQVKIRINNTDVPFQLISNSFPIESDGMVGMPFLSESVIDLKEKEIQNEFGNFSILIENKAITLNLKARTKQLITLPAKPTNLKEGYLPKIPAGPGVYLGKSLVRVKEGTVRVYCINTSTQDLQISIPPVEIEEFEKIEPNPRTKKRATRNKNATNSSRSRHEELINSLNLTNLNSEERESLHKVLNKFPYQFYLEGDKLGSTNILKHSINTINDDPVRKHNHRLPKVHAEFVEKECKGLYEDKRIQNSDSPYNSPVWVVPKKPDEFGNKRWRMVIDYRSLNEKTVGDAYPLPNITDILDQLGGAKYFTVLDLASGFHQIEVEPKDRHKTAFSTPFGHFEFTRMPFGLKNAPATFQRIMDRILSGLQGVELFIYMDDIVIYAKSLKEHQEKLERLLGRLKTAGLVLQPEKCRFLCKEIVYLGHAISENGVKPDPKKVEAVAKFPVPKGRKNVKQFLGLSGYYRRFIQNFATVAKPLTKLLKKNIQFHWTNEAQLAFDRLKEILCCKPLLQYPDFSKPFVVTTDSSSFALGAVLSQGPIGQDLPIAYASRTMNSAELNYTTTEQELLAITFAIKQFRPYIYGQKFILVTDHRPLVWLLNLKDPTVGSRLARWKIKLREFEYEVVFKPGRVNANADALSRNPINNKGSGESDVCKANDIMSKNLNVRNEVLFHEYPIERVFPNLSREFGNEDSTDCETDCEDERDETLEDGECFKCGKSRILTRIKDRGVSPSAIHDEPNGERKNWVLKSVEKVNYDLIPLLGERSKRKNRDFKECGVTSDVIHILGEREKCGLANHFEGPPIHQEGLHSTYDKNETGIVNIKKMTICNDDYDSDNIGERETSQIKGIWNDVIRIEQVPVKGKISAKKMRIENGESVVAKSVLIAKQKKGNIILKPLFKISNDKLFLRNDHLINFVSCDGILTTPTGRELMENSLITLSDIREVNPELGTVTSVKQNKRFIFNLFIKETYDSKIFAKNIELAVSTLQGAMESMNLKTISVSRIGNGLDNVPWNVIEKIFRTYFSDGSFEICICNGKVITPPEVDRLRIIEECHDSTMAGHKGENKTFERVRERFYWKGMREEIRDYVRSCDSCQRKKLKRQTIKLPMQITDTPKRFLEKVQIDIVGPLATTESGNTHILTWQDCLTKYSGAIPLSKIDAPHVAVAIAENIICIFGCPEIIQTDQGSQFMSQLMNGFAALFKIKQYHSSAYHPQSLGALERSHHTFVEYLRHYSSKVTWDQWLPYAMFSFNTSVHESTGITPHEAVFGRKVRFPSEFAEENVPLTYIGIVDELLNKIIGTESLCATRLETAKQRCKKYHDLKLNEKTFQVGEHVILFVENRDKLDNYYEEPYKIDKILNNVNLELQISRTETKIVHMNRLRHAYYRFM